MTEYFYGDVADFRTYHTDRGVDTTAYNDASVGGALIVASEWLDARYQGTFGGLKVGLRTQVREWPRIGAFDIYGYTIDSGSVPQEMLNATYITALKQLENPGCLALDIERPKYTEASVSGAVSVKYMQFSSAQDGQTMFATINDALYNIINTHGNRSWISGDAMRK